MRRAEPVDPRQWHPEGDPDDGACLPSIHPGSDPSFEIIPFIGEGALRGQRRGFVPGVTYRLRQLLGIKRRARDLGSGISKADHRVIDSSNRFESTFDLTDAGGTVHAVHFESDRIGVGGRRDRSHVQILTNTTIVRYFQSMESLIQP